MTPQEPRHPQPPGADVPEAADAAHPDPLHARASLMETTSLDSTLADSPLAHSVPAEDATPRQAAPPGAHPNPAAAAGYDRDAAREHAIAAILPHVPAEGWTLAALRAHAGPDADLLFPGGALDMIEAYIASADRRMVEKAGPGLSNLRLPDRVRALIVARLEEAAPHRAAIRRSLGILALPANAAVAARTLARTVDAIWAGAGDRSADFSWYTKRAILASVYTATLLFWLNEQNTLDDTAAFLDRRLAGVARITRLRRRFTKKAA